MGRNNTFRDKFAPTLWEERGSHQKKRGLGVQLKELRGLRTAQGRLSGEGLAGDQLETVDSFPEYKKST